MPRPTSASSSAVSTGPDSVRRIIQRGPSAPMMRICISSRMPTTSRPTDRPHGRRLVLRQAVGDPRLEVPHRPPEVGGERDRGDAVEGSPREHRRPLRHLHPDVAHVGHGEQHGAPRLRSPWRSPRSRTPPASRGDVEGLTRPAASHPRGGRPRGSRCRGRRSPHRGRRRSRRLWWRRRRWRWRGRCSSCCRRATWPWSP